MHITFFGATREVTGSMHMLATAADRILLDCGMFQGRRKESAAKNRVVPFDPGIVTNIVLSHAHIDHSGRLPVLTKNGFNGRIVSTRPTEGACRYLLPDAGHIQESDAAYLNYKTVRRALSEIKKSKGARRISNRKLKEIKKSLKKGPHKLDEGVIQGYIDELRLEGVDPLYTVPDAKRTLEYFDSVPYRYEASIGKGMTCKFYDAGHILGSAISIIKVRENGRSFTICFSGDLGRFGKPILKDPTLNFAAGDCDVDLMLLESTYGNRVHEPVADLKGQLKKVLIDTLNRNGTVLIPAFAFGRTQSLLYVLHELYNENAVPRVPVFVDSPLATNLTRVFGEHPEVYDEDTHETFLEKGHNPFAFKQMNFVRSVEASIELNKREGPQIIVAASGMMEAGRILHHLRYKIHNSKNTILLVGYMAMHTLGRRIQEQGLDYAENGRKGDAPVVKILGKEYPLRARVLKIGGFSAHADKVEMLRFLKQSNLRVKKIALVHGEEEQSLPFAEELRGEGYDVSVPRRGESIELK
jgi:metallo-beta-lactamase family protein